MHLPHHLERWPHDHVYDLLLRVELQHQLLLKKIYHPLDGLLKSL